MSFFRGILFYSWVAGECFFSHTPHDLKKMFACHFNTATHSVENMKVHIIDFIYNHPESERVKTLQTKIETNWISKLQSSSPL